MNLHQLDHVAITVTDVDRSIIWYRDVLGLEHRPIVPMGEFPQMMGAGETCVALFPASVGWPKRLSDKNRSATLTMRHFAFRTDRRGFEVAQEQFDREGIEAEFADHGACHSLYISDPDGHTVEITTYDV